MLIKYDALINLSAWFSWSPFITFLLVSRGEVWRAAEGHPCGAPQRLVSRADSQCGLHARKETTAHAALRGN
jgi:hypothetical protein